MDQLKLKIKNLRRKNASHHWFIPELSLLEVMTGDAIRGALVNWPAYQREETVLKAMRGKKIFGVLILLNHTAQLSKFIEADQLNDAKLPFKTENLINEIQLSKEEAEDFNEKQWEVVAPTFHRGTLNRCLGEDTALPFMQDIQIGKGAFGRVYEVALDPSHQELGELFPEKFARKELEIESRHSKTNSQQELKILSILNHLKHPNIVELLGSYTYRGKHNLLFPLAGTGNLAELLAMERKLTQFTSDETLLVALASLSSAVEHVHDFSERKIDLELVGCHHDLRPRNILITRSKFILADFGLSTFKSSSQNSATPFKDGNNDDYLAPECEDWDNGFEPGTVRRSSDIWSLGCILAEVATYMVFGCEGVKEFRQAREHKVRGFVLHHFHRGYNQQSDAVEDWLSRLERQPIRSCALLIRIVRQTLCMGQSERLKAKEITRRLRLVVLHTVAATINDLFHQIRTDDNSLDMFLEHTRFDSWRHAIGILCLKDGSNLRYNCSCDAMSQFDTILECLTHFREDLESRLLPKDTQRLDLSRLLKLQDGLHCFLSREQKQISQEYFNITVMEGDDELFEKVEDRDTSGALYHEIRMRANIKHINSLIARDTIFESRKMQVDPSDVEILDLFGDHHLGRFHNGHVLHPVCVEWRKYGQHGADEHTIEKLYGRAARIAELLSQEKPEGFRTLQCSGFFHEPRRAAFGVIFEIPQSTVARNSPKPTNLQNVIGETAHNISLWPDLDDRFKLASTLAASLLELHTVGWLHKNLTTSNITFFPETDGAQSQLIQEPFLVGFNHSRPDEPLAFTSGIADSRSRDYQHPTYLKESCGYRPEFDYYSLGIILIEIGFWTPFSKVTKQYKGLSYMDRCQRLLTDQVPKLRQQMGRQYCEAVKWCIECDLGGSESGSQKVMSSKDLLLGFGERVVARLRGCSI